MSTCFLISAGLSSDFGVESAAGYSAPHTFLTLFTARVGVEDGWVPDGMFSTGLLWTLMEPAVEIWLLAWV